MIPAPKRLLAKWSPRPDLPAQRETLGGHLLDVLSTAQVIVEDHGRRILESLELDPEVWLDRFRRSTCAAASLHDLGKANDQFQAMVRKQLKAKQAYRHEMIGGLLFVRDSLLADWIMADSDSGERDLAVASLIGHHLQADAECWAPRPGSSGTELRVLTDHPDFRDALEKLGKALGLGAPPQVPELTIDLVAAKIDGDAMAPLRKWWKRFFRRSDRWPRDAEEQRFLAAIKALLIDADIAGSAVPRSGEDPAAWTHDVLGRLAHAEELRELATIRLGDKPLRPFQQAVADSTTPVTLARAGCGAGKTTAAYLWASCRGDSPRKLFFCYPTTGTATEGFGDYVVPGSLEGRLIHGRAEVDLERLLTDDEHIDPTSWQPAFEALSSWDVPLSVCTADTVLGLIQNNRRGLSSFPAIGLGAFVFDEIHAYDARMFGALVRFLKVFRGVPVLLMTASLPHARRDILIKAMGAGRLTEVSGPKDLEELPRYQVRAASLDEAMAAAGSGSMKVLWVSNTVARCVDRGRTLEKTGRDVLPYHSRYRYLDRVERHRQVVDAFKKPGPALAVTTQVCEMSLDLSADLLVTDLAPIPALIQRLGRLNRRATPDEPGEPKDCLVLDIEHAAPYSTEDLELARRWLDALGSGEISQADLAREFEAQAGDEELRGVASSWLDAGPQARVSSLRDAGYTAPFIRAEDIKQAVRGRDERIRLEIPMTIRPVEEELHGWRRLGPCWIAPVGRMTYDERWGGEWVK